MRRVPRAACSRPPQHRVHRKAPPHMRTSPPQVAQQQGRCSRRLRGRPQGRVRPRGRSGAPLFRCSNRHLIGRRYYPASFPLIERERHAGLAVTDILRDSHGAPVLVGSAAMVESQADLARRLTGLLVRELEFSHRIHPGRNGLVLDDRERAPPLRAGC